MMRIALAVVLLAGGPAAAQATAGDCEVFGQIAERAAQARLADGDMMDTMVVIAESFTGAQERYAGAVPLLVDWVWKLPEAQLTSGVGAAYQQACEAQ